MEKKQVVKDALWVDVGDYFVTRDGRIFKRNYGKSTKTVEIKQTRNALGYLCFKSKGETVLSHRFIANAFILNPDNLPCIDHINTVRDDNRLENIRWVTVAQNNSNPTTVKKRVETRSIKVYQYALDGTFIREWPSAVEIQRNLGFCQSNINAYCLGKKKTAYGFIWSYDPPANHTR